MSDTLAHQLVPYYAQAEEALDESFFFHRGVEAADIVQEVALYFCTRLPLVRSDLEKFLPRFLKRACLNRAIDHYRAWKRYEPRHCAHEDDLHPSRHLTPLDEAVSNEGRKKTLKCLTAEQREVAELIEEGYSVAEISVQLRITESAVRMRLFAARKRLQEGAA
jgi:RNA polymerase sigma factor (sigma-70 family)